MEKLYYTDPYNDTFTARVLSCAKTDRGYAIKLDKTSFFPEQGGQYCDEGTIDGCNVLYVQIKNGEITHFTEKEIPAGTEITGKIDFEKRFDRMQNHTGEHIVSGLIHNFYGYENVGFHLSDDEMTLDTSGILSDVQLAKIEEEANTVVWNNIPVEILYPAPEELEKIEYRSKLDLKENVRLVKIGVVDTCACCAPHVRSTGEIGLIKIEKAIHYKGGMRINLACGKRAYKECVSRFKQTEEISNLLKVKPADVSKSTESLYKKSEEIKQKMLQLQKYVLQIKSEKISDAGENVCIKTDDKNQEVMRAAVNFCMERTSGYCLAFSGTTEDGFAFVLGKRDSDVAKESAEILKKLNGKGGGRGNMISGILLCPEQDIESIFKVY